MIFDLNDSTAIEVITTYLERAREQGKKIGLTSGTFDLIHYHHVLYFTRCRRHCDVLIVGVDSDNLVRERKGEGRPMIHDARRVAMVDAQKPVMFTCVIDSIADFGVAAKLIRPHIIFKNDAFSEDEIIGKEYAVRIEIVRDVVDHNSTSDILAHAAKAVAATRKRRKKNT